MGAFEEYIMISKKISCTVFHLLQKLSDNGEYYISKVL